MSSFVAIGSAVPAKKIFNGVYHIRAWRPTWSCDRVYLQGQVCINGQGHMTKMAAMAINSENL